MKRYQTDTGQEIYVLTDCVLTSQYFKTSELDFDFWGVDLKTALLLQKIKIPKKYDWYFLNSSLPVMPDMLNLLNQVNKDRFYIHTMFDKKENFVGFELQTKDELIKWYLLPVKMEV